MAFFVGRTQTDLFFLPSILSLFSACFERGAPPELRWKLAFNIRFLFVSLIFWFALEITKEQNEVNDDADTSFLLVLVQIPMSLTAASPDC